MKKIAIVILNYNGVHFLKSFLNSVIAHSYEGEVIIADNCSTDSSIDYLKAKHPETRIISLDENKGYSAGYNAALKQVDAQYYVLLNSDVSVTPNWIGPILRMMDEDRQIAACQPKILSFDDPSSFEYAGAAGGFIDSLGYPFCRGRLFLDLEKDEGQYDDIQKIFWATGACLFVRASAFWEVGGLDDDFFAHMEEIDLCWRLNNAAYKVMYNGDSKVYHVGGGTLPKSNPKKTYLNFRNGLALLYKNSDNIELLFKFPLRVWLDGVAAIKFTLFDSWQDGLAILKAHYDFYRHFGKNRKKRKKALAQRKVRKLDTIYRGSIVFQYYLRNKKSFHSLTFNRLKFNSPTPNTSSASNAS